MTESAMFNSYKPLDRELLEGSGRNPPSNSSKPLKSPLYYHELNKCLDALEFRPSEEGFQYLEIEFEEDIDGPIVGFGKIKERDVLTFFEREEAPAFSKPVLRIILSNLKEMKSPSMSLIGMKKSMFKDVMDIFRLPFAYAEALAGQAGLYSRTHPPNEENRFVYVIKPPPGTLTFVDAIVSYDTITGVTYGYFTGNIAGAIDFILQRLRLSASHARHPLLLLTIYLEYQAKIASQERNDIDELLRKIEHRTGHTIFYDEEGNPTGDHPDRIETTLFRTLSVNLAQLSYTISMVDVFNSSAQLLCDTALLRYFDELERAVSPSESASITTSGKELRQRIEMVQSICANNTIRLTAYDKRIQLQMGVVHNLIAQEDNMRNIELARDSKTIAVASKQDSSVMKVLAVLGTLFLPASFIATVFSMPLLNWDGDSAHTVQGQFWVFLAVTIPLTVSTMGISLLWVWWSQKRHPALPKLVATSKA